MGGPVYTEQQLLVLKESPLVRKPDGLPDISHWMEVPVDQGNGQANSNGTTRRSRGVREGDAAANNETRPLINPMGQFGRRQSMQPGEDTVLGPPKLAFASASRTASKTAADAKERTGITSMDGDHLGDRFPREKNDRWTRDRDVDRNRDKGFSNGRRVPREDVEGWTNVKGRKSIGQEDFERFARNGNGDRSRDKLDGELETDATHRRATRERTETRWGRRDDAKEDPIKPAVQGGWRERDRDRDRDRDWHRNGITRTEEDPEWLDTKAEKKELKPRTQEDFQRWKEQMRAKDTPSEERDEEQETLAEKSTAMTTTGSAMLTQPLPAPFATEPTQGILFGNWGKDTGAEISLPEIIAAKPKTDKKSRFMTMFAKPEEATASSQSPQPLQAPPVPGIEANADKEGFQRILQMLGQVNVGSPAPPQPNVSTHTNGSRYSGGVSLDFHQQSPPPEPQHNKPPPRVVEQQSILDNILAPRPAIPEPRAQQQSGFSSMSPDNAHAEQFRLPRPDSKQQDEHFPHQAPQSRHTPQDANLAAIMNNRSRDEGQRDQATKQRERDFLLTLMQQPTRATPPMLGHSANRPAQENHSMAFFDQPRQHSQQQPKGRGGLPSGFMEESRMYNDNEAVRRDNDRREQELRQQLSMQQQQQQQQQQEAMRAKNARIQMGFPGHDDSLMGLQRRNTGGDPRLTTNMGIPSQPVSDMQYMGGRSQQGMPPIPQERANIAPPPGFGGLMRQPPGLSGPNPAQIGPVGPSFSAGNTPLGHPPGFPPPGGNLRGINGMGFPGVPGVPVGNGMPGPPQGYFPPPPGYGPPIPGMRGEDPRMLFDGQFGGPGLRQSQGRPGPPNMY